MYGDANEHQHARGQVLSGPASVARRLYLIGHRDDLGAGVLNHYDADRHKKHRGLWGDAEEYLDFLETAALTENSAIWRRAARLLQQLTDANNAPTVPAVRSAARRLLAVECNKFLHETDPASERWEPFRRWRELLTRKEFGHSHTIITFNYDLVLETLGFQDWLQLPGDTPRAESAVLKLHGSVGWKRANGGFQRVDDPLFTATCVDDDLAIAPPGPSKSKIAAEFETLWKTAEHHIREAKVVFFIGYRFPPTDATSRRRLLDALQGSRKDTHIVLGPSDPFGDIARLEGMIRFAQPDHKPTVHRMWSQDFLSVFHPGLFAPH